MADAMVMVVKLQHGMVAEMYGPYASGAGESLAAELAAAQKRIDPSYNERVTYSSWPLKTAPTVERIERPYLCTNDACTATTLTREEVDAHFPVYRLHNEQVVDGEKVLVNVTVGDGSFEEQFTEALEAAHPEARSFEADWDAVRAAAGGEHQTQDLYDALKELGWKLRVLAPDVQVHD